MPWARSVASVHLRSQRRPGADPRRRPGTDSLRRSNLTLYQYPAPPFQEGVSALLGILAETNVVSTVNFTNTGCYVEPVFISLSSAVCQHLISLSLGQNKFTSK